MRSTVSGLCGSGWFGRCFTAFGLIALLGACATGERAEAIYLQQHRATTALAETIVAAEAKDPELDDACAPLRQAGYRKLYGGEVDGDLQWLILDSLDGCAAKTQEVEVLLWRVDPETAKYFLGASDIASAASEN